MSLPINASFEVQRPQGTTIIDSLNGLLLPASDELAALLGTPGAKLYQLMVNDTPDVREQDVLVSSQDATITYRVRGVKEFATPQLPHLELTLDRGWGS